MGKLIVADDVAAVDASAVVGAVKAGDDASPRIIVTTASGTVTYSWETPSARDSFFKQLAEGMKQAAAV